MSNPHVRNKLTGLLQILNSTHSATISPNANTTGPGRAEFIHKFLKQVIPISWRISEHGEITDVKGALTGELDIIENGFFPSLSIPNVDSSRLFFVERVAAVIEVKSDLNKQWKEDFHTVKKLGQLERKFTSSIRISPSGHAIFQVPAFTNPDPMLPKLESHPHDSIAKNPVFCRRLQRMEYGRNHPKKYTKTRGSFPGYFS